MPPDFDADKKTRPAKRQHPFQRAVLRGLAVILPPLLTIVILIWVWNAVQNYVLIPVQSGARHVIVWKLMAEIKSTDPGEGYKHVGEDWVPTKVVDYVDNNRGKGEPRPATAESMYDRYVELRFLRPQIVIPLFLSLFIIILYLLGKFLAIRFGRILWGSFEQIIHRLPIVRNVYSSVKQVTDFVFSEKEIEYRRVVAVEYPRRGVWSMGFVTGDSLLDIAGAANEPILSVFIPSSPMPLTGYTITILRSEAVDLDLTVDQAIQYVVSCGVVVAHQQLQNKTNPRFIEEQTAGTNGSDRAPSHRELLTESTTGDESSQQ